jgi:NitT/TauT family transport system substrate-binding protein
MTIVAFARLRSALSDWLCSLAVLLALSATAATASATEQVRIGIGFGLAFLPTYICEDLKLVEKYAREAHVDVRASYERFLGAGPVQDALVSGAIDMGPFGAVPLLMARDKAENTNNKRQQIIAVSGMTTMPLVLLSNRPNVHALADLRPSDRIAVPTPSSPQMYFLQMQSEKLFGQYDRLRDQVVELAPADALGALIAGEGPATAFFSSPPFTQIALKDARVHQILNSEDVIGGKASFLILGATGGYVAAHPKIAEMIDRAMDEAARVIHDDPRRAAQIYLAHEPSKALDAADIEAVLKDNKDEFGSAVEGIQAFADFLGRQGGLKTPPQSWKEIVAPALLNSPSS